MRKNTLQQRLNIIKGQLEGLSKLIDKKADCHKITQQFYAVNAGLKKVMDLYFTKNFDACVKSNKQADKKTRNFLLKQIIENRN